ncbi:MAG: hypothetical protein ABIJ43_00075 [Candidatus Beckwithbacteria bacterium]|nr:hypothetical protein [Patescibacteria group bacterium]
MTIEQNRIYQVVDGRNRQRVFGDLSLQRTEREKALMTGILLNEQQSLINMGLISESLDEITVNPDLTTFLDGVNGLGGYADNYAEREYLEPGTRLEMDLERREIRKHLLSILTPGHISKLRIENKPLIIVEGGAGPDLRTFEAVCAVLSERKDELQGISIQVVITDISKRMAAITASKIRTSSNLIDRDLNIETAVLAADVFELIDKLPENVLSYALLPFGVLSFGLDGKKPQEIMTRLNTKLVKGGGALVTVYNSDWRNYTARLENEVEEVNCNGGKLKVNDLNPFVIRILDNQMQVADGLAFYCKTFLMSELFELMDSTNYQIDSCKTTPQGWAYWPTKLLRKAIETRVWPEGCSLTPTPSEMNLAKKYLLELVRDKDGRLAELIPGGSQISEYPAPYITLTAKKQ